MSFYAYKLDRRRRSAARLSLGAFTLAPMRVQASSLPALEAERLTVVAQRPTATARTVSSGGSTAAPGMVTFDEGSISRNVPGRINPGSTPGSTPETSTPSPSAPAPTTDSDQDSDHSTGPFGRGYGWAYAVAAVAVIAVALRMSS